MKKQHEKGLATIIAIIIVAGAYLTSYLIKTFKFKITEKLKTLWRKIND